MKERDCANCKHHSEDGCSSWDCKFEAKDLISRADAIEAVKSTWVREHDIHILKIIEKKIKALPSADAVEVVRCSECKHLGIKDFVHGYCKNKVVGEVKPTDFCSYGKRRETTIPMFKESAEAYKAWTGEEMGKTSDEINEMNKEIIKDILKMMPTAYLLEALGVSTFEELTEQADRPHGEWIPCSERLPSEERYYLCCNKGYLPYIAHYYGGQWHDFGREVSRVDAWMPLPKPYREDGEV